MSSNIDINSGLIKFTKNYDLICKKKLMSTLQSKTMCISRVCSVIGDIMAGYLITFYSFHTELKN